MHAIYSFKTKNDGESLASQVCSFMRGLIVSRILKDGEKIPNESELSSIFKVSRMTVREAILNLVQQDLLHRHVGRGTFVKARNIKTKILWVCGKDITSGEISPYYSSELHIFSKQCAQQGWHVEPIWLGNNIEPVSNAYLADYDGFLFLSTDLSHPLLKAVSEKNLPYAHIVPIPEKSRFICPDIKQGARLGIDYLQKANPASKQIILIGHQVYEKTVRSVIRPNDRVKPFFHTPSSVMSEAIRESAGIMRDIIANEAEWSSIFVMDDVMALGVSEAVLKSDSVKSRDVHLLVSSGGSLHVPFVNPVTYLWYDIAAEAASAINILLGQIKGIDYSPNGVFNKFTLVKPENGILAKNAGISKRAKTVKKGNQEPVA